MSDNIKDLLLVVTGAMAIEYIKVLDGLQKTYDVVGNSNRSVTAFKEQTGVHAYCGGIEKYVTENRGHLFPNYAIVAIDGEKLCEASEMLIESGVKHILIEKPGAITQSQMKRLVKKAEEKKVNVFIGYNRRFYASVEKAEEIIKKDGGILSLNFEFTEWSHVIEKTANSKEIKEKWFLMNSSHVVDLAFYFMGNPKVMHTHIKGEKEWHPAGSIYCGCGESEKGILFTYQANWGAPGRWGIEILTKNHRLYLRPMEKLSIQEIGSVAVRECEIDDEMDLKYKAGLFREVEELFNHSETVTRLCTLQEQEYHMTIYEQISGECY